MAEETSPWRTMDLAPRSRDVRIDLVLFDRARGTLWREPDCCWAGPWGWQNASGRSVCGRRYYDDEGETCYDPLREDMTSIVALWWMPIPALPGLEEVS